MYFESQELVNQLEHPKSKANTLPKRNFFDDEEEEEYRPTRVIDDTFEEEKRFERNIRVVSVGGMNDRSSTKMMNLGDGD